MFRINFLIIIMAIVLVPTWANAQKIVVAKGPYKIVWDDQDSSAKSKLVADAVSNALKESGFKVERVDDQCEDPNCLVALADPNSSLEAVFVKVDENLGEYKYSYFLSNGKSNSAQSLGAFSQALKEMAGFTVDGVKSHLDTHSSQADPNTGTNSDAALDSDGTTAVDHSSDDSMAPKKWDDDDGGELGQKESSRKKLSPGIFWTGVALTGVLATTAILVEVGANKRIDEIKNGDESLKYIETTQTMQKLSIVFTCTAIAVGTATLVSAFFTDFKKKRVSLTPAPIQSGGLFVLQGSF